MKTPIGFTFAGVHAGLKPVRRDVALVVSDVPAAAAACFTTNAAKAAPILDALPRVPSSAIRAVVINSGNANALTGAAGLADVAAIRAAIAAALDCAPEAVLAASTGVIGARLPADKIVAAAPRLVAALAAAPEPAAEAIITTDTRSKLASRTLELDGREVTLCAIAKGSGMIAPQLATALAVIVTDAAIAPAMLDRALRAALEPSFHSLVVDGDMSTNDAVIALANGRAGNAPIADPGAGYDAFAAALAELCVELARDIAADGEGATKLVEVALSGAPDVAIARDLARAVAGSPLVKAALFGADPNWGRILATVGARVGARGHANTIDPARARVRVQGVDVYAGEPLPFDRGALRGKLRAPEVRIDVELGERGPGAALAFGCDLSYDYVKLNADYTSLIVQSADGQLGKDDRLANYSPGFKRSLLVEALSYIARFAGTRCVVKYGGAAMTKPGLEQAFCEDIKLLRSVGLQPIVVHGGGPEISRTLDKLGHGKPEFVDGVRVTSPHDIGVIEMVLGSINARLVTLLNLDGGHAMGVSGKDGALLRAKKLHAAHGHDLGQVGEITAVDGRVLEMLLGQSYVPVISPIAIGDDGQSYNVNADTAAAAIAVAVRAPKLVFLTDVAGILDGGELVSELAADELDARVARGAITGGMVAKASAILAASRGGVPRVHVIDGRTPHSLIAELFTDRGVGTLVTP